MNGSPGTSAVLFFSYVGQFTLFPYLVQNHFFLDEFHENDGFFKNLLRAFFTNLLRLHWQQLKSRVTNIFRILFCSPSSQGHVSNSNFEA